MIKVRPRQEFEVMCKMDCPDSPCECLVKRTPISTGQELYDAIKNPTPSLIVHDTYRNTFHDDRISEIFVY